MKQKNILIDIAIYTIMICTYIIPTGYINTKFDLSKLVFSGVFCILVFLIKIKKKIKIFDVIYVVALCALTIYTRNFSFMTCIPLLLLGEIIENKDYIEKKITSGNLLYYCLFFTILYTVISYFTFSTDDRGLLRAAFAAVFEKNQSAFSIFILGILLLKKDKFNGILTLILGLLTCSRLYFLSILMFIFSKFGFVKKIVSKIKVKKWSYALLSFLFLIILIGIGYLYLYLFQKGYILPNSQIKSRFSILDYSNMQRFTVNVMFIYMLIFFNKKYLLFGIKESTYMGNIKYIAYHVFHTHAPGIVPHNLFLAHLKVYGLFSVFELFYTSKYLKKIITENNFILFLIVFITSSILGCGLYSYWLYLSIFAFIVYMNKPIEKNSSNIEMKDKISVIIPAYKVEKYIKCCLDSVINQTYKNLEIILVDDGSPDSCGKICDEYAKKDDRIKVIHKENGGLSDARNAGIDIATGNYILFVDSDDYIPEYAIYELYKSIIESNTDICEGDMFTTYNHCSYTNINEYKCTVFKKNEALKNMMYLYNFKNSAWSKLYKREVIGNIRFPKGKNYEDLATTYKYFDRAKSISKIDLNVYFYYQNQDSIMHNKYSSKRLTAIEFAKEQLEFCKINYKKLVSAAEYRLVYECVRVLNEMPFFCNDTKGVYDILKKYRKKVINDKNLSFKKKTVFYSSYFGKIGIKCLNLIK